MTRHAQTAAVQAMQYIDHILRDGATPNEQRAAEAYLLRCRPNRQRSIPFPHPMWEGNGRDDEPSRQPSRGSVRMEVYESGHGSFCGGPDAGSTAAIPGQLVDQEVTEQGTDTHGE